MIQHQSRAAHGCAAGVGAAAATFKINRNGGVGACLKGLKTRDGDIRRKRPRCAAADMKLTVIHHFIRACAHVHAEGAEDGIAHGGIATACPADGDGIQSGNPFIPTFHAFGFPRARVMRINSQTGIGRTGTGNQSRQPAQGGVLISPVQDSAKPPAHWQSKWLSIVMGLPRIKLKEINGIFIRARASAATTRGNGGVNNKLNIPK